MENDELIQFLRRRSELATEQARKRRAPVTAWDYVIGAVIGALVFAAAVMIYRVVMP